MGVGSVPLPYPFPAGGHQGSPPQVLCNAWRPDPHVQHSVEGRGLCGSSFMGLGCLDSTGGLVAPPRESLRSLVAWSCRFPWGGDEDALPSKLDWGGVSAGDSRF